MKKSRFRLILLLLSYSAAASILSLKAVEASGTVYIRANGAIDPPTAPIRRDGNIYTLTSNITSDDDGIIIERGNMTLDGAGYTLEGTRSGTGITLEERSNVTIKNTNIKSFGLCVYICQASKNNIFGNNITASDTGIELQMNSTGNRIYGNNITNGEFGPGVAISWYSSNNIVSGNTVANNYGGIMFMEEGSNNSVTGNRIADNRLYGVLLRSSSNNSITRNNIANNQFQGILLEGSLNNSIIANNIASNRVYGVSLLGSSSNSITRNNITNDQCGIYLSYSSGNRIFHNNLINNTSQIQNVEKALTNIWDNGYPSGGNYWSDYTGADLYSGLYQNESGSDGIGDSSYIINENRGDSYPLVRPFVPLLSDLNNDGRVNILDISILAKAYGTKLGDERWNPIADMDKNNVIDIVDVSIVARDFGKTV
jgi:parallel beta-helix repeat protein